jgi:small GTP-binding protein
VVVGEFNAGKSALINALLGERLLEEGVTPTTAGIHVLEHGEPGAGAAEGERGGADGAPVRIRVPAPILRQVRIVDTPGTNALQRRHEAITTEFIPRADLVLFVTSADRPFSESERQFLERIREWGKKIVLLVNKADLLAGAPERETVRSYITEQSRALLQLEPEVLFVAARPAIEARGSGDAEALERSGLPELERFLEQTLDQTERVRLKLASPLGVAGALLAEQRRAARARLDLLADDLATVADIERQLDAYGEDLEREFGLRLVEIDNVLYELEQRGGDFFDERVRVTRLLELMRHEQLRLDFEREVVAQAPQQIESKVDAIIDWLVESDLNQWQGVMQHVNRRRSVHAERVVGEVSGRFESNRADLLETVGRAARGTLARYDREQEARRMAEGVQRAVAGTTLMEVGAVGLGATVALVASSTAVDLTGLVAASVMAALGLVILPFRRRRARHELRQRITELRSELLGTLRQQFTAEAERGRRRIRDTIAPYTRFVRTERERLEAVRDLLDDLEQRRAAMLAAIESLGR